MRNLTGQEFDQDSFQNLYDTSPVIQNIVASFDENGISLNVKNQAMNPAPEASPTNNSNIDSSAKKAANKLLQK